ncbi:hypothetical protein Poli38472_001191 [Pythium oligandrum]|uniref:Uncharacterized protein n=1 Tax=Pythium oligandrum TaxID=41045 RepID=A0A8K1CUR2_PYTOL|nr:hypothetical protein Poli38472_001191 [Pythium oligandrum]|eukprot:TMW69035.1 hypothetical protein Poli38472_001191 [Pythium oligandrum]
MPRVHIFTCEGTVNAAQAAPQRYVFYVYEDGGMTAQVRPTDEDMGFVYDGQATPQANTSAEHPAFDCEFKLARFWRHRPRGQFMKCRAQLSRVKGMKGMYFTIRAVHDDGTENNAHAPSRRISPMIMFQLPTVSYRVEEQQHSLAPLTSGFYKMEGSLVATSGRVRQIRMALELRPDGTVQDRDELDAAVGLEGTWSSGYLHIKFDRLEFEGVPTSGALRGYWTRTSDDVDDNERGRFELRVLDSKRLWSTRSHRDYPSSFRDSTKFLLLKAVRASPGTTYALPSTLWSQILSYCSYEHFAA